MKGISSLSDFRFAGASSVVLAIIASSGMKNSLVDQTSFASAFCSTSNPIKSRSILRVPHIQAGRDNSIDEWVSYLEEEFNRNGDDDGGNVNGHRDGKDDLRPVPSQRTYHTPVKLLTNAIDLLDRIDDAPPNDLTVVLFFAHYCKTCHRTIVPFKQLANDSEPGVTFVRFETSALSPKQFFSLGIDRVPFLQIYRNGICVASFSATQRMSSTSTKIVMRPRLLENISACQSRSMLDWSSFRQTFDKEIEANKAARAKIREAVDVGNINRRSVAVAVGDGNSNDEEEELYRSVRTLTSETELLDFLHRKKHFESPSSTSNCHEEQNKFYRYHVSFAFRSILSSCTTQIPKNCQRTPTAVST